MMTGTPIRNASSRRVAKSSWSGVSSRKSFDDSRARSQFNAISSGSIHNARLDARKLIIAFSIKYLSFGRPCACHLKVCRRKERRKSLYTMKKLNKPICTYSMCSAMPCSTSMIFVMSDIGMLRDRKSGSQSSNTIVARNSGVKAPVYDRKEAANRQVPITSYLLFAILFNSVRHCDFFASNRTTSASEPC